ncbi:acyl-[acyl-carrier-protein]--UDP-N-acetylglucosamine O-acyltransferase [Litorimonas taeanensis]|uniref:Acyl-[acyl-carrier-protein]--UDP-N-acetylglucosamine O-acyltransferase n=1 Tax=Litorimonas taeanensis TaxID=568099 RepID=A0A420WKT9_9PROT|nr:acyl-ACP--UDP-N-acetylglucosamine O-acyltransferase [Litorimonas taeanensis]RKQ71624.1 acyl-[acyl-carrier-protein]--UDP-N-acetylglucosamine O-acyltransferase [Litorimonas taeanensis]
MSEIHETAIVHPEAQLGQNVSIGPFCIVGEQVTLKDNVTLVSHVSLSGKTTIGKDCILYPFVSMGHPPQDFKHKGGDVWITIGERCVFRENVNIHPGTDTGKPETRIGNDCYFMVGTHLAHEGQMGNHVVVSNGAQIGGNVTIGDYVVLGGLCAIHQHTRIGNYAFIGGMATVTRDVIPYGFVMGNVAHMAGLNVVGLRRRGFTKEQIRQLRSAYRLMFAAEGTFVERLDDAQAIYRDHVLVQEIIEFIRTQKDRAICLPQ